jgi:UDP-N-acetylmuramoyl-tripeptide--D-alanyl-D-alanine ligase
MTKPLWTSQEIATAIGGQAPAQWSVNGLAIDSRAIEKDDLFIALKGPSFDGNDFAAEALTKGAAGVLVDRNITGADASRVIRAPDCFAALQKLGAAGRARVGAKIVAVTGSVGKTGCKEALRQIFSDQAPSYASVGSFNNHWGVPLSLARMPRESRYGVFEIGMNHAGELGPLSRMVRPHIALITSIAPVHIGNFESLEGIAAAKAEIFEGLEDGGHAVINADNSFAALLTDRARNMGVKNIVGFGRQGADARLESFTLNAETSEVKATILGTPLTYQVGAPGEHWVMNSLAALLCAALAGADLQRAAQTLRQLELAPGRGVLQTITFDDGSFSLVDESYNASPIAVEMAIRVLGRRQPMPGGRRLLALADMKELGHRSREMHMALLKPIEEAGIDEVYCCGEAMKHLFDALPAEKRGAYAFTSADLAPLVAGGVRNNDIVTVKGSHSMAMEKVVQTLQSRAILQSKKASHG